MGRLRLGVPAEREAERERDAEKERLLRELREDIDLMIVMAKEDSAEATVRATNTKKYITRRVLEVCDRMVEHGLDADTINLVYMTHLINAFRPFLTKTHAILERGVAEMASIRVIFQIYLQFFDRLQAHLGALRSLRAYPDDDGRGRAFPDEDGRDTPDDDGHGRAFRDDVYLRALRTYPVRRRGLGRGPSLCL